MKRMLVIGALALVATVGLLSAPAQAQTAQEKEASRNATREKLRQLLDTAGQRRDVNVAFRQSDKQPYNFVGVMRDGLKNSDSLEIVVSVTANDTIGFRVYPHYNGGYINIDKVKDSVGLTRKMLNFNAHNFLYWGADDSGDIFAGYTITLESGFPEEAIKVVLYSIRPLDQFVGQMRPFVDGTTAQK
jgi:opacity protein-like surface antigen